MHKIQITKLIANIIVLLFKYNIERLSPNK